MLTIPARAKERIITGIKKFQPILANARDKDINESDTVTIISDVLSEVFGYDKYTEITSEFAIKKTFCDLAIKLGDTVKMLIEVKAAGLNLKEQHIKQAVDYGSNSGIDWVILTNGVTWKVYKVIFAKPITTEMLYEFDITEMNPKKDTDMELLFYLAKESMNRSNKLALEEYHLQKQLLNKYVISQVILNDATLDVIRRNLKKISADTKVTNDEIRAIIVDEIIKRDVFDDEKAAQTKKLVTKALKPAAKPAKADIQ